MKSYCCKCKWTSPMNRFDQNKRKCNFFMNIWDYFTGVTQTSVKRSENVVVQMYKLRPWVKEILVPEDAHYCLWCSWKIKSTGRRLKILQLKSEISLDGLAALGAKRRSGTDGSDESGVWNQNSQRRRNTATDEILRILFWRRERKKRDKNAVDVWLKVFETCSWSHAREGRGVR